MKIQSRPSAAPLFLGIECGGTRTVALLADADGKLLKRIESGPANLRLLSDAQLLRHFQTLAKTFPTPAALGIGMAGARTEADRNRIRAAAAKAWPRVPCVATNDLETALAAVPRQNEEGRMKKSKRPAAGHSSFFILHSAFPRVLVLSGTGSCCFGKTPAGKTAKVGGWGHILGDQGSGFNIAMTSLQAVISEFDRTGILSPLGQRYLRALQLNEPDEFIAWAQAANKTEIAALAVEFFAAANCGDCMAGVMMPIIVNSVAFPAINCARRLARPNERVEFIFAGSNLLKQPRFAALVAKRLKEFWPHAVVTPLEHESVWGAVELARQVGVQASACPPVHLDSPEQAKAWTPTLSPTEQRNPSSMNLDKLSPAKAIALMLAEDAKIPGALLAERKPIERALRLITQALRRGGKLFYVGAGTSGRLGVLDASECPPTFRTPPDMVQAIIAGGQTAIWSAAEGAEDDAAAGARAVEFRGVTRRDVVVGIAASGRTPFVLGALAAARRRGARTVLVCFNPLVKFAHGAKPDVVIAANVGPEILTGSTRLKAGTATKLVLNLFTTLAMVRLGKVRSNLMVDVNASNEKLRDRAVRIVGELTGADADAARAALGKSGWVVQAALRRLGR
ncbi:MAG: N-acetylmuramic acid 6-phosphate etherase [Verrucomicrobia bacterium]|nr:N-acetylmuramic acid 6-phosphate etherase [Verrucomicrobiota bacterium]